MQMQLREEIDALRHMTVGELRAKYQAVFGEESRSNHKQFLFRRIAWRIQALAEEFQELKNSGLNEQDLVQALEQFDPVWDSLTTHEQARLVHLLIEKVGYDGRTGKVTVSFRSAGLKELCNGTNDTKTRLS